MKTNQTDKATASPFNPMLDNTAQDFSPAVDKFGALNHNIRCAKSADGGATWHNPYLADIMADLTSAEAEHAALVAVAEILPEILAHLDAHSRQVVLAGGSHFSDAMKFASENGATKKLIPAAKAAREAIANIAAVRGEKP